MIPRLDELRRRAEAAGGATSVWGWDAWTDGTACVVNSSDAWNENLVAVVMGDVKKVSRPVTGVHDETDTTEAAPHITSPVAGQVSTLTTNNTSEGLYVYTPAGDWARPSLTPLSVSADRLEQVQMLQVMAAKRDAERALADEFAHAHGLDEEWASWRSLRGED